MEIETLKRAAEFMGLDYRIDDNKIYSLERPNHWTILFNPESDANLLKKMEEKLSQKEFDEYETLMYKHWCKNIKDGLTHTIHSFTRWFKCEAPTSICFEKLMEVI